MTISEPGLLDTNVLVYAADSNSAFHRACVALRDKGLKGEISLCVSPQVLNEFFAIVTDLRRVSNPRSQKEAMVEIEKYLDSKSILKIFPGTRIIEKTLELLKRYKIVKQEIFDLQLVATMLSNNIARLYTYNKDDFSKFKEIEVLTP